MMRMAEKAATRVPALSLIRTCQKRSPYTIHLPSFLFFLFFFGRVQCYYQRYQHYTRTHSRTHAQQAVALAPQHRVVSFSPELNKVPSAHHEPSKCDDLDTDRLETRIKYVKKEIMASLQYILVQPDSSALSTTSNYYVPRFPACLDPLAVQNFPYFSGNCALACTDRFNPLVYIGPIHKGQRVAIRKCPSSPSYAVPMEPLACSGICIWQVQANGTRFSPNVACPPNYQYKLAIRYYLIGQIPS